MAKKRIDLGDYFTYEQLIQLGTSMDNLKQRYLVDDFPDDYKAKMASKFDVLHQACMEAALKLALADVV